MKGPTIRLFLKGRTRFTFSPVDKDAVRASMTMSIIKGRYGKGSRVQGAGCRVQGAGCKALGKGCRVQVQEVLICRFCISGLRLLLRISFHRGPGSHHESVVSRLRVIVLRRQLYSRCLSPGVKYVCCLIPQ